MPVRKLLNFGICRNWTAKLSAAPTVVQQLVHCASFMPGTVRLACRLARPLSGSEPGSVRLSVGTALSRGGGTASGRPSAAMDGGSRAVRDDVKRVARKRYRRPGLALTVVR
ncbi:hypothetical protein GCM10011348_15060 [Marinobacterium nitratireducens]|uniref:Uncharacterized protein n=1 Tax=Marinobacterium nitratireducens TaxID=518897 RepID=A0A918DR94_9GAMM|nr:hypothetical protein GCM10011348_15060 [Marinobacterium nitratireducens]